MVIIYYVYVYVYVCVYVHVYVHVYVYVYVYIYIYTYSLQIVCFSVLISKSLVVDLNIKAAELGIRNMPMFNQSQKKSI